ncbi:MULTISPECIES: GFA family protein [Sphingobium]|uniref:GFA family protein n=1 Tax=Sphingobium sp. MI1205 TaxID=407020 RepID=UPI00076FE9B4|nr:GFA family protein [Sphingobium sp. MI1205]AMK19372.1 hypothetical protein K663_14970 [Sphingobium sp. MI1205]
MTLPQFPVEGGCRCGRVRFRLNEAPWSETACHCHGCQKMTGSAFSTTLIMSSSAVELIAGETVIGGMHAKDVHHHHCDQCKSWIFTRPEADIGFINVRATLVDDASWFAPWMETQTAEKLPWANTGAIVSFERFRAMADYQDLVARYRSDRSQ